MNESTVNKVRSGIISIIVTLAKTAFFVLVGLGITWLLDYFFQTGFFIVPLIIGNGYLGLIKILRERNEVDESVVYQHLPHYYHDELHTKTVSRGATLSYAGVILNLIGFMNFL